MKKPALQINLVMVTGTYKTKGFRQANEKFKPIESNFLGNPLSIRKNTYELKVTRNFRDIFSKIPLRYQIKKHIELQLNEEIAEAVAKVSNSQYTLTLKYDYNEITDKLIPLIVRKGFEINKIEVNQEASVFFQSDLKTVLSEKNFYVSLRIKTCDNRITATLQPSKDKREVTCSIISSAFTTKVKEFFRLLDKYHGYY